MQHETLKNAKEFIVIQKLEKNTILISGHLPTVEEGCGISSVGFRRVVGGVDAIPGKYPWVTLVGYKHRISGELVCKCGKFISQE